MSGKLMTACVGTVMMTSGAFVGVLSGGSRLGSPNIEVRDDSGALRCLLGKLEDGGYGLKVVGEGQQSFELSLREGKVAIKGQVKSNAPFAILGDATGWGMTLTQEGGALLLKLKENGDLELAHAAKEAGALLAIKSQPSPGGVTSLEMQHPGEGDKASGLVLVADARGASVDLARGGKSAAQFASAAEGVSYMLLGARNFGLYMQATMAGNMLIELCNRIPRMILQSTESGTGLGIDRLDGSSALRLGLTKVGDFVSNIWTAKGDPVSWDGDKK